MEKLLRRYEMNVLKKLSIKNLKLNTKRTIGTIIGIILSTSLICAVISMGFNFQQTFLNNAIENGGYYHLKISELEEKDIEVLNRNRNISKISKIYELNYGKDENARIDIYSMDIDVFKSRSYKIVNGRFPKNENEIIVNDWFLSGNDYRVGDTVEIPTYKKEVFQKNQKYKIVGVFEQKEIGFGEYIITTNEKSDVIDAYIVLKNPKNYKKDILNILGEDTKDIDNSYRKIRGINYESKNYGSTYNINDNILEYEVLAFNSTFLATLITVISIVLLIIIVTSVFCIRNSFAIATTEKTKLYGMLISVGATKKQIRKNVIYEGFILGLIAIPIGIICGYLASYILIIIMNAIMGESFLFGSTAVSFNFNLIPAVIAIVLAMLTIYLSSLSSAIKASHTSPIKQLRNTDDIKIKSKKLKTPKFITKFFKTGGALAYKNLKRSKKKYRTTVISLTVSILVFIALYTFINEVFSVTDEIYIKYDYNVIASSEHNLDFDDIDNIKKLDGVKKVYTTYVLTKGSSYMKNTDFNHVTNMDFAAQDCEEDDQDEEVCGPQYIAIDLLIFDPETFKEYCHKAKIDYASVKDKAILNDDYSDQEENGKIISKRIFDYQKGDLLPAVLNDKNKHFKIGAVTDVNPYGREDPYIMEPRLIVSFAYFDEKIIPQTLYIDATNAKEAIKKIKTINPALHFSNMEEEVESMRNLSLIVSIFLYGFITVITLIGITNIFNTITSNMELRQKEFAMLKSVGMTKKEFNRMINLETIFYSFKSLFYGITIGILLSYLIHLGINKSVSLKYHLPIIPIIICIIFVFLLVSIIMKYSINKISRQNTIETIRNDNI